MRKNLLCLLLIGISLQASAQKEYFLYNWVSPSPCECNKEVTKKAYRLFHENLPKNPEFNLVIERKNFDQDFIPIYMGKRPGSGIAILGFIACNKSGSQTYITIGVIKYDQENNVIKGGINPIIFHDSLLNEAIPQFAKEIWNTEQFPSNIDHILSQEMINHLYNNELDDKIKIKDEEIDKIVSGSSRVSFSLIKRKYMASLGLKIVRYFRKGYSEQFHAIAIDSTNEEEKFLKKIPQSFYKFRLLMKATLSLERFKEYPDKLAYRNEGKVILAELEEILKTDFMAARQELRVERFIFKEYEELVNLDLLTYIGILRREFENYEAKYHCDSLVKIFDNREMVMGNNLVSYANLLRGVSDSKANSRFTTCPEILDKIKAKTNDIMYNDYKEYSNIIDTADRYYNQRNVDSAIFYYKKANTKYDYSLYPTFRLKELGIEDEQIEYEEIGLEIVKIFNERVNSLNPAILHYLDYGSLLGNDEIDSVKLVLKEEGYSLGQNDSRFLDSVDNNVSDFLDEVILRYKNRIASIQISSYGYADNVPFRKKTLEKYNSDPVFNDIKSAICEWKDGQILCFEYLKFHKLKGKHNKKRNYILNLALANLRAENRLRKVKGGIDELSSGQLPFPITTKRAGIFEEYNSGKMFRKVELVITVRLKRIS